MATRPFPRIFNAKNARPFFVALGLIAALWMSYQRLFDRYELQTYDWRFAIRGARPEAPDVVLIDIWDDTLAALGRWPFDREYHAALIEALSAAGARAVIFDVEFVEPHDGDEHLARAAQEAGNVYFAFGFASPIKTPDGFISHKTEALLLPSLAAAAKGVGYVNAWPDLDGKRRRAMPFIMFEGTRYFQLSFRVLMDILEVAPKDVVFKPHKYLQFSEDLRVPLDEDNCFIINYAGLWSKAFQHYSYVDILSSHASKLSGEKSTIDLKRLKGKICIIGLTAQGTHDSNPNPLETVYPGMGSYANIINTVLERDFIRRLDRNMNMLILLLMLIGTGWAAFFRKPMVSFFYTLALLTMFVMGVINLFIYAGVWADLFYPVVVVSVGYSVGILTRIILEMRKRELMESELKIASQIQQSFLPVAPPQIKGLDIAVFMRPAKAVGGDLYTFVPLGEGKVGVMVGDVSGKGTPAALFMGKTVSEFKFSARDRQDPAQVLTNLNDSISSESTGGLFVTLSYAIFDLPNRTMTFSNGGHLPLVVADTKESSLLEGEGGMPVGVMPGVVFVAHPVALKTGSCIAFYSDGISEARNRKKEEFGVEALAASMKRHQGKSAEAMLKAVVDEVTLFIGKAEQHDDMTLILVQVTDGK